MLEDRRKELLAAAREVAGHAYAPYSAYRVGAAVLTASGEIVSGCNVENASYGLSLCAERNAVVTARARGLVHPATREIVAVAVYSPDGSMPWPCGACRQVMYEFAPAEALVLVEGPDGIVESTIAELLPRAFALGDR